METVRSTLNRLQQTSVSEQSRLPQISDKALYEKWVKYLKHEYGKTVMNEFPKNFIEYIAAYKMNRQKQGLFIYGGTGTGKTSRFKFMREFTGVKIITAKTLFNAYINDGIEHAMELAKVTLKRRLDNYPQFAEDLVIDDLGDENESAKDYGTEIHPLVDIIENRYIMFRDYHAVTHFTANLTISKTKQIYGDRIFSRLNEMCMETDLTGEDHRIKAAKHV